jgi:hypothetical protein
MKVIRFQRLESLFVHHALTAVSVCTLCHMWDASNEGRMLVIIQGDNFSFFSGRVNYMINAF